MDGPRALLDAKGLRPKKRFGQNFLTDLGAARRIARIALDGAGPATRVLEVGAGTGQLTLALVDEGAIVTAIEIDRDLAQILRERTDLKGARIELADAMTFDYADYANGATWRVAGNLPYNIATPLIVDLIEMDGGPSSLTVMIQKDVADRMTARPGTAAYGSLSVAVQTSMRVERAFNLGPRAFFPAPNVESTVLRLDRYLDPPVRPRDLALYRKVVRGAFAYRRKTLVNSLTLALDFDRETIARALTSSNLSPEQRGERLDIYDFARLADALAEG